MGVSASTSVLAMNTQDLSSLKETINKTKRQPSEWETMFANEAADEGLASKVDKQLSSPNFSLRGERLSEVVRLWFSSLRRSWSVSGLIQGALLTVEQAQMAPHDADSQEVVPEEADQLLAWRRATGRSVLTRGTFSLPL